MDVMKFADTALWLWLAVGPAALAQDGGEAAFATHNLWLMLAALLVFVMHLGFAALETGLTRAKNAVNVLFKNVMVLCIGVLSYAALGFSLMYPGPFNGVLGWAGPGLALPEGGLTAAYNPGYTYWTDFLFQAMFAATAATIVSGAVAERMKLEAFLAFSTAFLALSYPVTGSWLWGEGWLSALGFHDFAGSTLVHAWAAGPRWWARCWSGRAWASTRAAGCAPSPATASRWPRSGCCCSGSAGSGSTAARCCRPIQGPSRSCW